MISEDLYYRTIAAAQIVMNEEVPDIKPDGKWGSFTQATYEKISRGLRGKVDMVISAVSSGQVNASGLRASRNAARNVVPVSAVGNGDIRQLIAAIALKEGVPPVTALKIAYLESRFNPKAVSPTGAKGVFQLTSIAIKDIAQRGGFVVTDPFDPVQNITGGIKYIKIAARDIGARLDETAKVYMAFNIGPTGARHVLNGQPEKAAKQIRQQAYGPVNQYASNLTRKVEQALA